MFLVVALVVGIIAGPLVANGIDPYSWDDMNEITKQITRCVIAIQVFPHVQLMIKVMMLMCIRRSWL